jgi:hypothetical protein
MVLARGEESSSSPGHDPILLPGNYYIRIGVFAEKSDPEIRKYMIITNDNPSTDKPQFSIKEN